MLNTAYTLYSFMKFNYPDLTTESVNGMRLYITPSGDAYPSITTVLGHTVPEEKAKALKNWANAIGQVNAQKKTQAAADRGTAVHLMIERHLMGEQPYAAGEFDQAHVNSFNALKLKLKNINEIWCQEVALFSDVLSIAGRVDCIGVYKGTESIIDFKTSTRLKSEKDIEDYRYQLCAYACMHNEMFETNINHGVILMTSDAGFPQEFHVDLTKYVEPLYDRVQDFYSKLKI
jgi:CRISPR/Cas system-associated exonuclease Cas4 (RecB family)